jgi:hypothetical protein
MSGLQAVPIVLLGITTLIGYYLTRSEVWSRAVMLQPHLTRWYVLASVGATSTVGGLIGTVVYECDSIHLVGVCVFLVGASMWPLMLRIAPLHEHYALVVTSAGVILWAVSGTNVWWCVVARVVSAVYHVTVDLGWYMTRVSPTAARISKFAAWNGVVGMQHLAFAMYVMVRDQPAMVMPRFGYQRWSSNSTEIWNEYNDWSEINLLMLLPCSLLISAVGNITTYLLLLDGNTFVTKSIGLDSRGAMVGSNGNPIRTTDWFFSAAIMQMVLMLMMLPPDVTGLLGGVSSTMLTMVAGFATEVIHNSRLQTELKWTVFAAICAAYSLIWIPVVAAMLEINPPGAVWVAIGWMMLLFSTFAVVMAFKLWDVPARCFWFEVVYLALGEMSKQPLLANLYGGILARSSEGNDAIALAIGFGIPTISGFVMLYHFKSDRSINGRVTNINQNLLS